MLTLLRPSAPAFATDALTPGDNARICVKLRLERGSAFTSCCSTTIPTSLEDVSTCCALPTTCTSVAELVSSKEVSNVTVAATLTSTVRRIRLNPGNSADNSYCPGGTKVNT